MASLLRAVADGAANGRRVEWVDVYDLDVRPCRGCMKCRPDGECVMRPDDGHRVGRLLRESDALIVGTPTHWGNMSTGLKLVLDRNVPALMGEKPSGLPEPRHKGKSAVIVSACTTPWPFNVLTAQSRGAVRAVKEVLFYSGFRVRGVVVRPGTKRSAVIPERLLERARRVGARLQQH